MKEKVDLIFALFDSNDIKYYLLRPLDFREEIKDVDLIVLESDLSLLKEVLISEFGSLHYKPSNANSSLQLLVDGLLLDLKFSICFLPRKSLVLNYKIPFSKVVYKTDYLLVPDVKEELFTFWAHHLFLDKEKPSDSSTFLIFKYFYSNSWSYLIETDYFKESLIKVYSSKSSKYAKQLILTYFNDGINPDERNISKALRDIIIRRSLYFQLKYIYDKFKFGIYRRLGYYENYREIK
tara:strand:+ start:3107 stop:3817 length:711 start_codon:yes stop_codon:yes gene_type:complete